MNAATVNAIAKARGQHVVLAEVKGKPHWFLVDDWPCTIEDVAASLGTTEYLEWACGELLVFAKKGYILMPTDIAPKVIRFFKPRKRAKAICGRCGRSRVNCCDRPNLVSLTGDTQ